MTASTAALPDGPAYQQITTVIAESDPRCGRGTCARFVAPTGKAAPVRVCESSVSLGQP